jgi:predicted N-formylglutamate amidohydrolase
VNCTMMLHRGTSSDGHVSRRSRTEGAGQHEVRTSSGGIAERNLRLLVTCEHAGNRVPPRHASLFRGKEALLASHRGWDPGALAIARALSRSCAAPLRFSLTTRLLVDLNRDETSPEVFSELTRDLSEPERRELIRRYHRPYRARVGRMIESWIEAGFTVVHVGVHTFTPVWLGRRREVDVGILFDPARPLEQEFADRWSRTLSDALPGLTVRPNEPYLGTDDGFTLTLRTRLPEESYLGVELEVSQHLAWSGEREERDRVTSGVGPALSRLFASHSNSPSPSGHDRL